MKVLLSPQFSEDLRFDYTFEEDKVIASLNGESDTFDFSDFPDGVVGEIETNLSVCPILSAERREDILYIELLNFIDVAEFEEIPEWQEV